jgi:hypothetical protein
MAEICTNIVKTPCLNGKSSAGIVTITKESSNNYHHFKNLILFNSYLCALIMKL